MAGTTPRRRRKMSQYLMARPRRRTPAIRRRTLPRRTQRIRRLSQKAIPQNQTRRTNLGTRLSRKAITAEPEEAAEPEDNAEPFASVIRHYAPVVADNENGEAAPADDSQKEQVADVPDSADQAEAPMRMQPWKSLRWMSLRRTRR